MRWRLVLLAALAGAAAALIWAQPWSRAGDGPLRLYGNVDIREVDLAFRVSGRIAALHLEEGDRVVAGDAVARLDAEPFEEALALADAKIAARRAELRRLEVGTRPQEIARTRAELAAEQAALVRAERDFARQEELFERGDTPASVLDDARAARDEARARVAAGEQALDLAIEGPRAEDIAAARAELAAAEAERAQAETARADTELTAPAAGVVLSRIREPGAIVAAGAPVVTLTLREPLRIRAYIAEPDLGRIAPGQAVEVVTDTFPDDPRPGRIGFISPTAEFTPRTVQTEDLRTELVYRVHVIVDAGEGLHQGMPVTVRVPRGEAAAR